MPGDLPGAAVRAGRGPPARLPLTGRVKDSHNSGEGEAKSPTHGASRDDRNSLIQAGVEVAASHEAGTRSLFGATVALGLQGGATVLFPAYLETSLEPRSAP